VVESSKLVLDTRNALGANAGANVFRLGAPKVFSPGAGPGAADIRKVRPETAAITGA
jgi:hypothetical protein